MGAGNVKLVFGHYAGRVPAGSLVALAYMALVALDGDDPPMYWGGHDTIALGALGKTTFGEAEHRAVRRVMTPLFRVGAVAVDRHSAPGRQVRYRLNLHPSSDNRSDSDRGTDGSDTGRKASGVPAEHRTESDLRSANTGRKVTGTPDGKRPPKEEEEELKQDVGLEAGVMTAGVRNARSGSRAAGRGDEDPASISTPAGLAGALRAPPDGTDDPRTDDQADDDQADDGPYDLATDEGTDAARQREAARLDAWIAENGQAG